ncbi:MAG TPA: molecular chaperone DnaK [Caldisericia bacterium]|nr:molecular chaperone DnaK [Caldisericia bacterium]HOL83019.1 molecular chaperone DnaK [Caldisericia bacterium]HPP43551.1 molecular chaperone DnaK [Caldisericia bacterium]
MARIIGIDLGTSNSAAAVIIGGKPTIIPAAEGVSLGGKTVPSYVAFTKDGQLLVGEPARRQMTLNPERTITGIKRKMGTNYRVRIDDKEYTPEQISAFILQKIKKDAEAYLGERVEKAVITVPAYFNDNQRQATKDAGRIAGLEVVRLINEPTAAAFAYGLNKSEKELKILVFDFGGGTLDVTIMDFGEGVFQVVSTSGDTQLGGRDMDEALLNYVVNDFRKETGVDLSKDPKALPRLREAVEKAKIELSSVLETEINLPFITVVNNEPKHLVKRITRALLEELVKPIVDKCRGPLQQALEDAKLSPNDIDNIILVGGPTRMPIVQKFIENFFGKPPERGVDPMECVAIGAAIQAGILEGSVKQEIVLQDVTPLTLGIETLGGIFTKMIDRNSPIPIKKTQTFTTAADNQTSVEIHILQGERPLAKDNVSLGRFILDGIPPAPRGIPKIEVTYEIDENGILHVTAKDLATNKSQNITVTQAVRLSEEEVEKMKKEAEKFAEEDKKMKEEIETRNLADQILYTGRKTLKDNKDKVSKEVADDAERKLDELENLLKEDKIDEVKKKLDEVNEALSKVGEEIYKKTEATGTGGQQGETTQEPPKDENKKDDDKGTINGDYEVK